MSTILLTNSMFTRTGPQCGVCNAWKLPCERCAVSPRATVISEEMLLASMLGCSEPAANEMAAEVVRTGATQDRLERARKQLGAVEVDYDCRVQIDDDEGYRFSTRIPEEWWGDV